MSKTKSNPKGAIYANKGLKDTVVSDGKKVTMYSSVKKVAKGVFTGPYFWLCLGMLIGFLPTYILTGNDTVALVRSFVVPIAVSGILSMVLFSYIYEMGKETGVFVGTLRTLEEYQNQLKDISGMFNNAINMLVEKETLRTINNESGDIKKA